MRHWSGIFIPIVQRVALLWCSRSTVKLIIYRPTVRTLILTAPQSETVVLAAECEDKRAVNGTSTRCWRTTRSAYRIYDASTLVPARPSPGCSRCTSVYREGVHPLAVFHQPPMASPHADYIMSCAVASIKRPACVSLKASEGRSCRCRIWAETGNKASDATRKQAVR